MGSTLFIYLGLSWGEFSFEIFSLQNEAIFFNEVLFFNEVGIKKSEVIKLILVPNTYWGRYVNWEGQIFNVWGND